MTKYVSLDELEFDLGSNAALRVLSACGGQRRMVPSPDRAHKSALAGEIGQEAVHWLASRFAGEEVHFPTGTGRDRARRAALLTADILDAGLTEPTRSANDIAKAHKVSARHVERIRSELRQAGGQKASDDLPLFRKQG